MTDEYVLDTSVAVPWYLPEALSPAARAWQERLLAGRVELLVPRLHYWEFANVLRTYVRRGELSAGLAREIYALHLDAPLTRVDPGRESVLATALDYGSTVYDAVYIQLALDHDVGLLTAERSTTPWVTRLGQRVTAVSAGVC